MQRFQNPGYRRQGCLGCLGGCLVKAALILAVGAVAVWAFMAVMNPWALHIGGRQTPLLYWHGVGTVVSKDGKSYPLYLYFSPGRPQRHLGAGREGKPWSADLVGNGWLCVAPGKPEYMKVSGVMYGGTSNANDSLFTFRLLEWRNPFSINPPNRGFFDVAGTFVNGDLALTRPDEQGIRLKTGPFIDHATVTLHFAEKSEFDAACR